MVAADNCLADDATVILHVPKGRQLPKEGDVCESIDQDAFRCDEDGISVTWVEHFNGEPHEQLRQAAVAMKGGLKLRKSGVIISAKVGEIRSVLEKVGVAAHVQIDKLPGNAAHCLIKGVAPDNASALLALTSAFPRDGFVPCSDIAGLL